MLQIADVVHRGHHRHRTADGRGVLYVQHIGMVFADPACQVEPQPQEGVSGHPLDANVLRNGRASLHAGHVCQDVSILVMRGKCVQKASNVYLVACEVSADGVGINGDKH